MRVARRRRRDGGPHLLQPPQIMLLLLSSCWGIPWAGVPPPPPNPPFGGGGGHLPRDSHCNGVHPHQHLNPSLVGHSPSSLPPPAPLLPGEEFYSGKKKTPPPANRTHDSTFLLALVSPSLARGSPWPPQPHPLAWKSGSSASSILSPSGFSSFIWGGEEVWVLDVRAGRFA